MTETSQPTELGSIYQALKTEHPGKLYLITDSQTGVSNLMGYYPTDSEAPLGVKGFYSTGSSLGSEDYSLTPVEDLSTKDYEVVKRLYTYRRATSDEVAARQDKVEQILPMHLILEGVEVALQAGIYAYDSASQQILRHRWGAYGEPEPGELFGEDYPISSRYTAKAFQEFCAGQRHYLLDDLGYLKDFDGSLYQGAEGIPENALVTDIFDYLYVLRVGDTYKVAAVHLVKSYAEAAQYFVTREHMVKLIGANKSAQEINSVAYFFKDAV